jgi:hypothetical protein
LRVAGDIGGTRGVTPSEWVVTAGVAVVTIPSSAIVSGRSTPVGARRRHGSPEPEGLRILVGDVIDAELAADGEGFVFPSTRACTCGELWPGSTRNSAFDGAVVRSGRPVDD